MSIEVLLLGILCGITLLAYLVAVNSHGPTRLSISYLIATILLAGTVWAIVQHVNSGLDREQMQELRKLEREKQKAEERIRSQEEILRESKERAAFGGKLNALINKGTGYATTMMNVDLRDLSLDIDRLMGRAGKMKSDVEDLKAEFVKLSTEDEFFNESLELTGEALKLLHEAATYFRLYYRSEDSAQESLRERVMRRKAREAYEKLQKASGQVASSS